jgi:GGDEF domain-containing protein
VTACLQLAAERVRGALAAESFVELISGGRYQITCSIGVAALGPAYGDSPALLARADRAMYAARRGGRNRVVAGHRADAPSQRTYGDLTA